MMTTSQLVKWIDDFRRLQAEMQANGDPQSLMVAGVMVTIEAHLASCAQGDERGLRSLFDFTGGQAVSFISEANAAKSAAPN